MYDNHSVLKKSEIPPVASWRLSDEDRDKIWTLIQLRNVKKLSKLFRDAIDKLLESEQSQQ
jgi:hypothetical protein